MKVGILFDLDGTLLDTLGDLQDSVNYAMGLHGWPQRTLEEIRCFVGNGARRLIQLSVPEDAQDQVDAVLAEFQAYYRAHTQVRTKPYDGVLDALKKVGEKYPVAVVSNKPDAAVQALAAHYFPGVLARGESADCPRKPAPDMVFKAMEQLGVEACVYVGDSEVDVLTAQKAGAPCLTVLWGFRDRELLEEAGAKHFCENVAQLDSMIDELVRQHYSFG